MESNNYVRPVQVGQGYKEFELKGDGYHITGYTEEHIIGATVTIFGKMAGSERELPPADNMVIALGELALRLKADQEDLLRTDPA